MAYFECLVGQAGGGGATITVSYSSSFYNLPMTCSNGTKTYTKTTTSSGSTSFNVSDEGTWTITCNGTSVSVYVTLAYMASMKPDGSTVTPINDVQTWLKCGGINKNYTTINQVLADSTTLLALMSDNNAVDYLVRSTSWTSSITGNATAMTDIGANNYCATTLLANATWSTAICNSTYYESVLNRKVPTMTSNTTPSGVASASSTFDSTNYPAWRAFDSTVTTGWIPNDNSPWIQYDFGLGNKIQVNKVYTRGQGGQNTMVYGAKVQGSNDGTTFTDLANITLTWGETDAYFAFVNDNAYRYYRIQYTSTTTGNYKNGNGANFQFYGRASS